MEGLSVHHIQQGHIVSQRHRYVEGVRFQCQAVIRVHLGRLGRVRRDLALVSQQGCEQKQMHLGQVLADASPLA